MLNSECFHNTFSKTNCFAWMRLSVWRVRVDGCELSMSLRRSFFPIRLCTHCWFLLEICARTMSMPICEKVSKKKERNSKIIRRCDSCDLVYYKFRFYGISTIPVYILHSFIFFLELFVRSLPLSIPPLSCTFTVQNARQSTFKVGKSMLMPSLLLLLLLP